MNRRAFITLLGGVEEVQHDGCSMTAATTFSRPCSFDRRALNVLRRRFGSAFGSRFVGNFFHGSVRSLL